MATRSKKLVNVEEAKLEVYDPIVTLNDRNELYFNPLALTRLEQTVIAPTDGLGFQLLSSRKVALHLVQPGSATAVAFKRPANKRTARCSFSAILALKPFLKVPKGRLTRFPFRIDRLRGGGTRFVILLLEGESEPTNG
jgi:hypothetical protein